MDGEITNTPHVILIYLTIEVFFAYTVSVSQVGYSVPAVLCAAIGFKPNVTGTEGMCVG